MVEQVPVIVACFIEIVAAEECQVICAEHIKIASEHVKVEGEKSVCDCSMKK